MDDSKPLKEWVVFFVISCSLFRQVCNMKGEKKHLNLYLSLLFFFFYLKKENGWCIQIIERSDLMVNNIEDEISKPSSNVALMPLGKSCIRLSFSLVWQPVKEKDYSEFKSRCGILFSHQIEIKISDEFAIPFYQKPIS